MDNELFDDEGLLIQAVADGNKPAFEKLFHLYHPRVYKFSMRMLNDHHQAEEVVCDTLYAVWTSASNFRGQSKLSTWILGIAHKRALKNYSRQLRYTGKLQSDFEMEELQELTPGGDPEVYTNNAMEGHQLMAALATLSADHRAVIELTALGHSVSDIAHIVGCPENTVKTRTFHARRKLRSAMLEDTT